MSTFAIRLSRLCVVFLISHVSAEAQTVGMGHLNRTFVCMDSDFRGCVEVLADSVSIWEEEAFYHDLPSLCHLEICTTLLEKFFRFQFVSAQGDLTHWHSWIEIMARADVPEANLILEAWVKEGRSSEFNYSDERPGGFQFRGTDNGMEYEFTAFY